MYHPSDMPSSGLTPIVTDIAHGGGSSNGDYTQ